MKLLLKSHLAKLPKLGDTEFDEDPKAIVKLFNPTGIGTWYITEYDPETEECFGLVDLYELELGYFSLKELKELELPFGLGIERDMYFTPTRLSELR